MRHSVSPSSRAVVTATRVVLWKCLDFAGANKLASSRKNPESALFRGVAEYWLSYLPKIISALVAVLDPALDRPKVSLAVFFKKAIMDSVESPDMTSASAMMPPGVNSQHMET